MTQLSATPLWLEGLALRALSFLKRKLTRPAPSTWMPPHSPSDDETALATISARLALASAHIEAAKAVADRLNGEAPHA